MIGFNSLGLLGRLGNQMFQYASLKGIARNNNYQYCIPPSQNKDEWKDHQLFNCFNLKNLTSLNIQYLSANTSILYENGFCFNEDIFNTCPDWVNLSGFFQTEKYFIHIKDEINKDFTFNDYIIDACKEAISTVNSPIALHIRRTDFITNPNHYCLSLDYYSEALKFFDSTREVLIFTDDSDWCEAQELFAPDRFLISTGQDTYHDLCLMTLCEDHIISNSTYSWWGAWLAENNKVIAPKDWFGNSNNKHLDTKDIIPERWEKI
jgi:hypothetical protein